MNQRWPVNRMLAIVQMLVTAFLMATSYTEAREVCDSDFRSRSLTAA
jgi:hypothetical protein